MVVKPRHTSGNRNIAEGMTDALIRLWKLQNSSDIYCGKTKCIIDMCMTVKSNKVYKNRRNFTSVFLQHITVCPPNL